MSDEELDEPIPPPPDTSPSDSQIIIGGRGYNASPLSVDNWIDREHHDFHFTNQKRSGKITEVILHETVTRSHDSTVRVLKPPSPADPGGRNLGVHFIVEADGIVYQHGDVATDLLWHASQHNGPSVGIEVVNPYDTRYMPANGPWNLVIDAPWAATPNHRYVVPTKAQAEAAFLLTMFLVGGGGEPAAPELNIPLTWIGLRGDKLAFDRVPGADKLSPGIYAHQYFNHADGAWLVLYCWLRAVAGLDPASAHAEAVKRATGARSSGVSIADLITPK